MPDEREPPVICASSSQITEEGLALVLAEAALAAGEDRTLILAIDQAEELFDTADQTKATEAKEFFESPTLMIWAEGRSHHRFGVPLEHCMGPALQDRRGRRAPHLPDQL